MTTTPDSLSYNKGDTAEIEGEFRDTNDALYDPTSVAFRYKDPADLIAPVVPTKSAVGIYLATFAVPIAGTWLYEWSSTGGAAVMPGSFEVLVSPLDEPTFGRVARATQTIIGLTWARLEEAQWYGVARLNQRVLVAKQRWAASVASTDESNYPAVLVDYLSKRAALEIIPAGIEYWMDQKVSQTSTGTNEVISRYGARQKSLQELAVRLERECALMMDDPALVSFVSTTDVGPDVSDGSDDGICMQTPNPYDFPEAFGRRGVLPFPLGE